eukprot:469269_1
MLANLPNSIFVFWLISIHVIHDPTRIAHATSNPSVSPFVTPVPTNFPSDGRTSVSVQPTNAPSPSSTNPTRNPTSTPTEPTKTPTYAPPVITACNDGTQRVCYTVDIAPLPGVVQSRLITIQDTDHGKIFYDIYVTPTGDHCVDPSITLTYEQIGTLNPYFHPHLHAQHYVYTIYTHVTRTDYNADESDETLTVIDPLGSTIKTCTSSNACGKFASCVTNQTLGVTKLAADESNLLVTLRKGADVDDLCSSSYNVINAQLTIFCSDATAPPTKAPTAMPSNHPTAQTVAPTNSPTGAPTEAPSVAPTPVTTIPTHTPTAAPSKAPSFAPSASSTNPTRNPTSTPTEPTNAPSNPTQSPTFDQNQYVEIWYDNMDTNDGSWNTFGAVDFPYDSNYCEHGNSSCARTTTTGYIEKVTNIASWTNIQLQVHVSTWGLESNDFCAVWYQYDNEGGIVWATWGQGIEYKNQILYAPASSSQTPTMFGLRMGTMNGDSDNDRCYFDNIYLRGIIANTAAPTDSTESPSAAPTRSTTTPTTPSEAPSFTPTQLPSAAPSAAPISPTRTPSLNPSDASSHPPTLAPNTVKPPSTDTPTRSPLSGAPTVHGQTMTPSGTPSGVPTPNHKQSANPTHKPSAHPIMIDPPTLYVGFVSSSIVTTVDASDTRDAQHGEMAPQKELLTDTMLILIAGVGSLIIIACAVYLLLKIYRLYVSSKNAENMVNRINNTENAQNVQIRRVDSAPETPGVVGNVYNMDAIMKGSAKLTREDGEENEQDGDADEDDSLSDDFWDKGKVNVVTSRGNITANDNADLIVQQNAEEMGENDDAGGILDEDDSAIAEGKVIQMVATPGVWMA